MTGEGEVTTTLGDLRGGDVGKWIMHKGLDRPKQITAVMHHPETTAVQWFRDPVKRGPVSGMVARHDCEVTLSPTPPGETTATDEATR